MAILRALPHIKNIRSYEICYRRVLWPAWDHEELFISTNTVKTHLKNIYGKLSIHNRSEAILKAQEMELL
jgi:hypothetical protein